MIFEIDCTRNIDIIITISVATKGVRNFPYNLKYTLCKISNLLDKIRKILFLPLFLLQWIRNDFFSFFFLHLMREENLSSFVIDSNGRIIRGFDFSTPSHTGFTFFSSPFSTVISGFLESSSKKYKRKKSTLPYAK